MRMRLTPLPLDPRYPEMVRRYVNDLPRFVVEVLGQKPTWQQMELYASFQRPGSRTSVASGHGSGKTAAMAAVAWWKLLCFFNSNTILSGPKLEMLLSGVRKYFSDYVTSVEAGPYSWVVPHVVIAHKTIYIRGYKSQWWIAAKTAPAGKPEAIAGEHRRFLSWLIDEASGVDEKIMGVILGSLTEEWNRIAMMSQPTRASGMFYDSHHRLNELRGGSWRSITMSSEESPLVSDQFIEEKLVQYGGREDPQYQIKVLGVFPEKLEGQLLSRAQLEACIGRQNCIPPGYEWGWIILVDVAAGEYRDKSVVIVAKVSGHGQFHEESPRRMHIVKVPIVSNSIQPTALEAEIVQIAGRLSNATVMVDAGGLGLSVYKRLTELGLPSVQKVLWGKPCWRKTLAEQFFNRRAHGMVSAAKAAINGHLSIAADAFSDSRVVSEFLDQCRVPYHYNDKAQYVIESKGSKEWEGIPSPDMMDAVSFGFIEDATYMVSEVSAQASDVRGGVNAVVERMRAERAARAAAELGCGLSTHEQPAR